jgi:hypothetical protein
MCGFCGVKHCKGGEVVILLRARKERKEAQIPQVTTNPVIFVRKKI